ncbi:uncharacterized protein A1O9_03409 [Exophiala aquamarina CBS 119918]|uniref:Zn(2)-C6 fungal-type domain-containing protein n=1 Tax=Exophiala aquamarina CBS 119918 TaxID=1182545 RepID=A0A072PR97_9EURO|nr:uncharacterized protein A1O9_03409 [Exophiala aquamarina CBS 119918]KEF61838.1 hypothetical protein A1O9_03409 [Exophiala aquamarina CBS 119918]
MASVNIQPASQPMLSQRRPVTSCLECYRRKQKCNRRRPCNQCTFRKIPEQCIFRADKAPPNGVNQARSARGLKPHLEEEPPNVNAVPTTKGTHLHSGYLADVGAANPLQLRNGVEDQMIHQTYSILDPQSNVQHVYCGLLGQIPPANITQELLKFFFEDLYWGAMTVDENRVLSMYEKWRMVPPEHRLRQCENRLQRELQCFTALLFQMLAQALYALPLNHVAAITLGLANQEDLDRLSETYHINGNRLVQLIGRHQPTMCSVEHDLLAFCWLKNAGRYSEAWYRLGGAVRQAQQLGLHRLLQNVRQCPESTLESNLLKIWDLEHQKRLWARLFVLDSAVSLVLEKPRFLHREDCLVSVPLDCEYPRDPARTIPVPNEGGKAAKTSLSLTLAHRMHDIISLSAGKSLCPDYSRVMHLHTEVCTLRDNLLSSWEIDPDRVSSNMSICQLDLKRLLSLKQFEMVLFSLHKPYIKTQSSSYMAAVNAALRHLDLQYAIFEAIPLLQRRAHDNPFYIIDISIFITGLSDEGALTGALEQDLHRKLTLQAIERLVAIKRLNPAAASSEKMLRQFCQKFPRQVQPSSWELWPANLSDSAGCLGPGGISSPRDFSEQFPYFPHTSYFECAMENVLEPAHALGDLCLDWLDTNQETFHCRYNQQ